MARLLAHEPVLRRRALYQGLLMAGFNAFWSSVASIAMLAVAAFFLDGGVIADQALGRRAINLLAPESRGRVNGLYTGLFFVGSAIGATIAGPVLARWGWPGICIAALVFFAAAAGLHLRDSSRGRGA